jgi:predicted nucleotidyltransferase
LVQIRGKASDEIGALLRQFRRSPVTPSNLRQLGDQLAPTKQTIRNAKGVIAKVVDAVHKSQGISVDRCCVTGSFGKGTATRDFDIDLVVFVNESEPPFSHTLSELSKQLPKLLLGAEMEKKTQFSVQFYLDGFNVDLLPGPNFVQAHESSKETAQFNATMDKIKDMGPRVVEKEVRYWGSAFAETTVAYMKQQQSFVNAAVRLAKLWKNLCVVAPWTFPRWFSSHVVEIISSDLAAKELAQNSHDASLVRVMEHFFRALSSPQHLVVVGTNHKDEDIPVWIKKQRPLVLDPVNPFNNLAMHLKDWKSIELLASSSLALMTSDGVTVLDLFQPRVSSSMSSIYHRCNFQFRMIAKTESWIRTLQVRSIRSLNGKAMNPGVEWRSKDKLDRGACSLDVQEVLLSQFVNYVNVSTTVLLWHVREAKSREVASASSFVDSMLSEVFQKEVTNWTGANDTHESRDISFTFGQIPIPSPPDDCRFLYLKLSVNLLDERIYRLAYDIQRELERQEEENDVY